MEIISVVKVPTKLLSKQLPNGAFTGARNSCENYDHVISCVDVST